MSALVDYIPVNEELTSLLKKVKEKDLFSYEQDEYSQLLLQEQLKYGIEEFNAALDILKQMVEEKLDEEDPKTPDRKKLGEALKDLFVLQMYIFPKKTLCCIDKDRIAEINKYFKQAVDSLAAFDPGKNSNFSLGEEFNSSYVKNSLEKHIDALTKSLKDVQDDYDEIISNEFFTVLLVASDYPKIQKYFNSNGTTDKIKTTLFAFLAKLQKLDQQIAYTHAQIGKVYVKMNKHISDLAFSV